MEYFATVKGIKFVNDCIATIPHSVMCAVEALGDVDTLISAAWIAGSTIRRLKRRWRRAV